jgi:hypothetical protein
VFVYETYEPGKLYGTHQFRITRELIRDWLAIYASDSSTDLMPPGLVILMQQQAYKAIVAPRPPGHVQGRQQFQVHVLPPVDSIIHTQVSCISKEMRKERRWVEMGFRGRTSADVEVYTGINTILVPC